MYNFLIWFLDSALTFMLTWKPKQIGKIMLASLGSQRERTNLSYRKIIKINSYRSYLI